MKIENVEAYIQLLNNNDLSELKLKTEEFELHLKKAVEMPEVGMMQMAAPTVQVAQEAPKAVAVSEDVVNGMEVKSPIVGVVYLTPEPGKPPYVHVGDHVKKGQKLAIISAMKVMNDFVSPVDGIVREIKVQSEDIVEFDQVLFVIE